MLAREQKVDPRNIDALVDVDFDFHHRVALASGNPIYPMFINSFELAAKNLAAQFFAAVSVAPTVFGFHRELATAVASRDADRAATVMVNILDHGRTVLQERLGASLEANGETEGD